jgi:hypothetical protein
LNADAEANTARREKGAPKKEIPDPQPHNKKHRSKTKTKITKHVRSEKRDQMTRELSCCRVKKKHNRGRRGHREGERIHLLPYILVTAPVFHFDTSWLNTDADENTAKERVQQRNKEKKEEIPTHHNQQKSTIPKKNK